MQCTLPPMTTCLCLKLAGAPNRSLYRTSWCWAFWGLRSISSYFLGGDSGKNPASLAAYSFVVFTRGLPDLISLAGAVNAGYIFRGDSDGCCRLGRGLAGVRGLLGVLFTRVWVLFRLRGVSSIISVSLSLSVSFSVISILNIFLFIVLL